MDVIDNKSKSYSIKQKISKSLYKKLSDSFHNTKSLEEDNEITKQLLTLIRDFSVTKEEIKMLLKGITRHTEHHLREFRENGWIVTSCIFKDRAFKVESFANYDLYKNLILDILGPNETEKDDVTEYTASVLKLPKRHKIKYLKSAIEILKHNEEKKFEDVFENLFELIKRSSNRTLKQSKEYLKPILTAEYDSFEKIKSISLLIERKKEILQHVIDEIFDFNYNLKNKIDLIFALIVHIETSEFCDYKYMFQRTTENKKNVELHPIIERYLEVFVVKLVERL